jgi:hypothetical protein
VLDNCASRVSGRVGARRADALMRPRIGPQRPEDHSAQRLAVAGTNAHASWGVTTPTGTTISRVSETVLASCPGLPQRHVIAHRNDLVSPRPDVVGQAQAVRTAPFCFI